MTEPTDIAVIEAQHTAPTLDEIMAADNVADLLTEGELMTIGKRCQQEFEYDWESGAEWRQSYKRWMDIALQVRKAKAFPWSNAANVKLPLLTSAAIQFNVRAAPVIIDDSNLVKGRVLGPDPDGIKADRAQRIGQHMSWQLLYDMNDWVDDTDKLLLMLPIVGTVMRKTYRDRIEDSNVSEMVPGDDFVINYWTKSLKTAPRYTHILRRYPYQIEENIRSGLWYDVRVVEGANDKDQSDTAPIEFLEQFCRLDLDGDGYPEPYIVTLTRDGGDICRIACCFTADDIKLTPQGLVKRIKNRQYFTKYPFIPAPDGSFYDIGFGKLLDDITAASDTVVNQSLDAGTLQNAQGGFIGSGINIRSGNMAFRTVGEWKRVDVLGGTLRDNIVPLNLPGPSAVLFNLLELLISMAEKITSSSDALSGQSPATEQPTTLLARIQQATKVLTGIFKRIHRSFGDELRILRGLNKDYVDEDTYYALNDEMQGNIGPADYEDKDLDVVPVSDPASVNDAEKMTKVEALMIYRGDPMINQQEVAQRYFEATGQRDIKKLFAPAPPPDPQILIEGAKLALEKMKVDAMFDKDKAVGANALMDASTKALAEGLLEDAAMFAGAAMKLAQESTRYTLETPDGQPADGQGAMGGMEGPGGDASLLPAPDGAAIQPDDGMGPGPDPDGGGPGGGEGPAPVAEPVL